MVLSLASPRPSARPGTDRRLALCVAAICLFWLSLYLYVPLLSPRAHALGAGVGSVGLILAAYGVVQFLLRIPLGVWSDRLGSRQPFLVLACAACAVAAVGMGLAHGPWALGAFRAVSGLGACGWVAITLLFAEFFPAERTGHALGVVGFLATGSQLVGSFVGGVLAQYFGMAAPFFAAAGMGGAGLLCALAIRSPGEVRPRAVLSLRTRLAAGADGRVLRASAFSVAAHYLTFVTMFGFSPLLATVRFHAGGLALGLLAVAAGVPAAAAALWSGPLASRWPRHLVVAAGFVLAALGTVALVLAPSLAWLDLASVGVGLGGGVLGPTLMTSAVAGCPPERRGAAMGFFQSLYAIGMFGGPALAGVIGAHLGMDGLFLSTAALCLGAAGLAAAVWAG